MKLCPTSSLRQHLRMFLGWMAFFVLAACTPPAEKARQTLLKQGVTANAAAVTAAAASGQIAVLELLQTAGQDLSQPPPGNQSLPLLTAIKEKSAAIPLLLQATPASRINLPDEAGRTVLSHAISSGNDDLVVALLAKSADPGLTTHPSGSVLDDAINQARFPLVLSLLNHIPPGAPLIQTALITAVQAGHPDVVAQLLEHQASPNLADVSGTSLLEIAAAKGDLANLDLLVKAGAHFDPARSKFGNPLTHAVQRNSEQMTQLLLRAGCQPDEPDPAGGTPTGMAATQQRLALLELFLQQRANPQPHFQSALLAKDIPLLELLVKYQANPNQPDLDGNPPLIQTTLRLDVATTKWLLAHGADPTQLGKAGQTAFSLAQALHHLPLIELFLDAGADPNEPFKAPVAQEFLSLIDNDYFKTWLQKDELLSPMMLAASRGDLPVLRLLMKFGAKRGSQTKGWKRYPVNFACENSHIPAAQLLLGQDPDSNRNTHVVVSLSKQQAWIYRGSEIIRKTTISTGKSGFATPSGKYVISDKQADWKSSIYKVPMPFFMRLSCKDFGLHAGVVTGRPASHGCVRLPKAEAEAFFSVMQIGDPVTIVN